MPTPFVHLAVHSEYSLVDSVVRLKPLIGAVSALEQPAIAINDQGNMFALVRFYKTALASGIKPLVSAELRLYDADRDSSSRVLVFAMNLVGYRNLTEIVSKGYTEGQQLGIAFVNREWLFEQNEGLLVLSGGKDGEFGQAVLSNREDRIGELVAEWTKHFSGRFYIQIQRTGRAGEDDYLHAIVPIAAANQIPLVATNDVRFLKTEEFEAHETRVCINQGRVVNDPTRPRDYSPQQYLRSGDEMAALFADLPSAIENSIEIAKRCNVQLLLGENFLPDFPVPEHHSIASFLREESEKGLEGRLELHWRLRLAEEGSLSDGQKAEDRAIYEDRLDIELKVIEGMGFPGYFLIVADFIQWAKRHDIPVGPGRGSGAGSLVAYALKITDLDPLKYDLLFERFLNPERVSMPDFDVDFCMDRRDEVISYVADHYGRDKVSQIATFGTMAAKAAVRDVGRALGQPFGLVDRVAKMIPNDLGINLQTAYEESPELKQLIDDEDEEVAPLYRRAKALEGLARNSGKHAGGVVISPTKLTDFTPLICDQENTGLISQFDKDDVEAVGLVKFDFLGLRTLTIIDWALEKVNRIRKQSGEALLQMETLPLDDQPTYELLKSGKTTAVFQLESGGMQRLLTQLLPDRFEDVIALVALYRPGPLGSGMVEDFVACKHGRQQMVFPHPSLEEILSPTYGIILYQEQVMQIAQILAKYSLGGADILRRAMGKKKPEVMAAEWEKFRDGSVANDVEEATARYIWDLIEKFAGYGFNKSHSAAYALLTYHTAWLKQHYPSEFMAAVMSADMDNTDKVVHLISDARNSGLDIFEPSVNESLYRFDSIGENGIMYGLGAIKGVGFAAIDGLIAERKKNGEYRDVYDLTRRNELGKVNRRVLETLVKAGAMDCFGHTRSTMMGQIKPAIKAAQQAVEAEAAGQVDLFGLSEAPTESNHSSYDIKPVEEWEDLERLTAEKATLGLYLTGHPITEYAPELKHLRSADFSSLIAKYEAESPPPSNDKRDSDDKPQRRRRMPGTVVGWVIGVRIVQGKRASMILDDQTGRIEVQMFWEAYEKFRESFVMDSLVIVDGNIGYDDFTNGYMIAPRSISTIGEVRNDLLRRIEIDWNNQEASDEPDPKPQQLNDLIGGYRQDGRCPVVIKYRSPTADALIRLGKNWDVMPSDLMIRDLRRQWGDAEVRLVYRSSA
jgi:DNA polymerase-3 subunit alpha